MILIGENIHIISKSVREALENRDEVFIGHLIEAQAGMDYIDFNVGPARGELEGVMEWLCKLTDKKISFDTTNENEIRRGLATVKNPSECIINSTKMLDLAAEYGCGLIVLTMDNGIPKTADERLEIAFEIYEKINNPENLFFDPLVLPISVDQQQAVEVLNAIRMLKASFDPPIKTVIGLSNISNGAPKELRQLINRVFGALAFGAGLDAAIIDAKDTELVRIFKMLERGTPENETDEVYLHLSRHCEEAQSADAAISSIYEIASPAARNDALKTAEILLNKKIYSPSFTQI